MIKHKWIGAISLLLMAIVVAVIVVAYGNPSLFAAVTGTSQPKYVAAMDKTKIMDIQIIADEKAWKEMLDNAVSEEYIVATVVINGVKIENVGIRPKGNSSLSIVAQDDTTDRFSFKIEFDHYITGQTWLGIDKLVVNNMQGDASYMKEYLSYDIMSFVGVESPLYAFSDISVNGESWGFYLAIECLEDSYAQRVYGNNHGSLYKPESMGMRGGKMNEFIEDMPDGQMQMPPKGEWQGEQIPPDRNIEDVPDSNADMDNQRNRQMQVPPGENLQNFEIAGANPDAENQPDGQAQIPPNENFQNPGWPGGSRGGFGGMASSGTSLQYTDNEISSYSSIFDNSVFDSTKIDHQRVVKAFEKLSKGEDSENTVDIEAVLKYFAAHTSVVNLDSYVSNMAHNYYLYEKDGQLTILPWDYNLAFGGFQSGNASSIVNFPIDTPVSGVSLEDRPLLGKLLEVPEYMEMYHGYLRQIVDDYFNSGLFEQTIDSMNVLISSYVENDPTAFYDYDEYTKAITELKKLGLLRAESIDGQLNGTIPSTTDGQSEDPSKLVDASDINISALGSMGGGFGGKEGEGGFGGMQGIDFETIQKAMQIISSADQNELTDEQLNELSELGLTDEQIVEIKNMRQGGFGGMRGGDRYGENRQNMGFENQQLAATTEFDMTKWLFVGVCTILLLLGLIFVAFYNRRRN